MDLILALSIRRDWFHDALQKSLEPNGIAPITRAQAFVLGNIAAGEHRAINIARNLGVTRQAVSQIVAELEKRGVVTLSDDPLDGRSRLIKFRRELEENGNACADIFAALEKELERRIGKRRFQALADALEAEWGEPPVIQLNAPAKAA